jgi:hypothetical protein
MMRTGAAGTGEWGFAMFNRIEEALVRMGETAAAVADTVRSVGAVGRRESGAFENPLVRYLNRTLDIGGRMEVGSSGAALLLYREGTAVSFPRPSAVRDFLAAFHGGAYPDLVQPPSRR